MNYDFSNPSIEGITYLSLDSGEYALCGVPHSPEELNGDSAVLCELSKSSSLIAVADGVGGHQGGPQASKLTIERISQKFEKKITRKYRKAEIIDAIESANEAILAQKNGSATTLILAEIEKDGCRFYFAGDSLAMVFSPDGTLLYRTMGHNPIDLGIEAGILEPETYDYEDTRHFVTNYLGTHLLKMEISALQKFPKDSVYILASDGLYDNLPFETIGEFIAEHHDLTDLARAIKKKALRNMEDGRRKEYSKPDDLTFVVYRA